jgi:predicted PurR-regulated permease PerM
MSDDPATTDPRRPAAPPAAAKDPTRLTSLTTLLAGVIIVACLYFAQRVLIPITLAILLSFLLSPVVNMLRAIHMGRVSSVITVVVLALGVVLALAGLIGSQVAQLAGEAPAYQATVEHKIDVIRNFTIGRLSEFATRISERAGIPKAALPRSQAQPRNIAPQPVPVQVQPAPPSPLDTAATILAPAVYPLVGAFIVFLVTIFILLQREDLRDRMIRLFGSGDLHRTTGAMDDAARRLSRYFLAQLSVNAGFGCVIGLGLAVIGIPSPALWGTLTMMLRFVPYIGVPIASLLPLALAAAVSAGWSKVFWTAGLYLVCEMITGQAVEPVLYGRSTGLSPAAVMIAAIFWTWMWGPIGLVLSTPLTLCLVVLGRHFKRLEYFDVLLGDRPALSPVESFYQRLLAGDPDEAEDQAAHLLQEMPLSAYYDEVAMRGLQLAANDAARGVLEREQIDRIKSAAGVLIHDLHEHPDHRAGRAIGRDSLAIPPIPAIRSGEWAGGTPVLCVAGRGPIDGEAAAMLAHLLGQRGLGARTVPHESIARGRIDQFDTRGVAMLCLCYLEINGAPAHLRFLLHRLRRHLPERPVLVGFWSPEDEIMRDERLRAELGADIYVSSLRQAVDACLRAANNAAPTAPGPVALPLS